MHQYCYNRTESSGLAWLIFMISLVLIPMIQGWFIGGENVWTIAFILAPFFYLGTKYAIAFGFGRIGAFLTDTPPEDMPPLI